MLARLQQAFTLGLLAAAALWLWYFLAQGHGVTALLGAVVILLGHAGVMAFEYGVLGVVNRDDPAPPSTLGQRLRAWAGEVLISPTVFCWRQPFRSRQFDDYLSDGASPPRRGVLLVHGFVCNRGIWNPWMKRLRREGVPFVAVNLEPVFGSIDAWVPCIEAGMQRLEAATGTPPLIVCHSMGGLAVRAWLERHGADARVERIVTIGTPHHGTWMARFSVSANGTQMKTGSAWLRDLAARETPQRRALFTCYYSHCDNVVMPASTATLEGADNRHVAGIAHVHLAFCKPVMDEVFRALHDPHPPPTASTSLRGRA